MPSKPKAQKAIKLSNRDVNFVSVIVQQRALPRDYLLAFAKKNVSPDAFLVVESILDEKPASSVNRVVGKKIAKKSVATKKRAAAKKGFATKKTSRAKTVADDFSNWASSLR